jgi:hypothetical protein
VNAKAGTVGKFTSSPFFFTFDLRLFDPQPTRIAGIDPNSRLANIDASNFAGRARQFSDTMAANPLRPVSVHQLRGASAPVMSAAA